jgi:hypothetical protein
MSYVYIGTCNGIYVYNVSIDSLIPMNNTEIFIIKTASKINQNSITTTSSNSLVVNTYV